MESSAGEEVGHVVIIVVLEIISEINVIMARVVRRIMKRTRC